MRTISHQSLSGIHQHELRCLKPVLRKWLSVNKEVADAWGHKDVPWWYGERACLSIFAGAVWKAGGIALEEYSFEKRNKRRGKRRVNGRNDLYFTLNGRHFIVEAKASWSGAAKIGATNPDRIQESLNWACTDIRKCPPDGQRRLGIAFIRPYFHANKKHTITENLKKWIETLKSLDYSCAAWVFPKESRYTKGSSYCPGLAVLIKEIYRG